MIKDFSELSRSAQDAICIAIGDNNNPKLFTSPLRIEFRINGIELDLENFLKVMDQAYSDIAKHEAQRLKQSEKLQKWELDKKLSSLIESLERMKNDLDIEE